VQTGDHIFNLVMLVHMFNSSFQNVTYLDNRRILLFSIISLYSIYSLIMIYSFNLFSTHTFVIHILLPSFVLSFILNVSATNTIAYASLVTEHILFWFYYYIFLTLVNEFFVIVCGSEICL